MHKIAYVINYVWRLIGTCAAFAFIFIGGGLFAMTVLRSMSLVLGHSRERAQFCIHKSFQFYTFMLKHLGLIDFEFIGADRLKDMQGRMVIANHPSLLDVVVLMSLIPKTQCIVKNQLWKHFFLGAMMREAGYLRNDLPAEELVAKCNESLKDGYSLIVFPEGTRTTPGKELSFQRGFANVALLTKAQIVPVVIKFIPATLIKGEPWWKIPPYKPHYRLEVKETLDVQDYILYGHNSLNTRGLVKFLHKFYNEELING